MPWFRSSGRYSHPLIFVCAGESPMCVVTTSMRRFSVLGIVTSTKDPSYPRCCTCRCQGPSGSFSFLPCVLVPGSTSSDRIQLRAFGVPPPATLCGCEVFERRRLCISLRRWVPSSLHSWLSQWMPVRADHLCTSCSFPFPQQVRMCLSFCLGIAEHLMIAFVPIPYLAISIHVWSAHDLGTAVRPHQGVFEGQHGDDVIMPRAPVCWLTSHSSVSAMRKRSPLSVPFSM